MCVDLSSAREHPAGEEQQVTTSISCTCLTRALKSIEQLHGCHKNEKSAMDHVLHNTRDATEACEIFATCSCQRNGEQLLLYIAVLQQIKTCYDLILKSPNKLNSRNARVKVGDFESEMLMNADLCRVVLSAEMEGTAKVATNIRNALHERHDDELKYQTNLIETICKEFRNTLDAIHANANF